jgi:hypothetical protein
LGRKNLIQYQYTAVTGEATRAMKAPLSERTLPGGAIEAGSIAVTLLAPLRYCAIVAQYRS